MNIPLEPTFAICVQPKTKMRVLCDEKIIRVRVPYHAFNDLLEDGDICVSQLKVECYAEDEAKYLRECEQKKLHGPLMAKLRGLFANKHKKQK